ncbi:MMP1 collagenase, partial [Pseudoatta argentina]
MLYQMRKPQCGLPDILHHEHNTGRKKWAKTHLTWNFHLADVHTLKTTAFAFSLWKRNEEICSSSFDGPGGVLAHAFYSSNVVNYTAEIHVDSTEQWHTGIYLTEKSASNKDYLMSVRSYLPLQAVFPGISSAPTLAFRYINDNLYFAKKQQFYTFNEFTRTVTEIGIRAPSPMYVGNLTLRFGRINNLPILRLETTNVVEYIRHMDPEQFDNLMDELFEEIKFVIDRHDPDEEDDSGYGSASDSDMTD